MFENIIDLFGLEYEPLFDYECNIEKQSQFKVLCDEYVSDDAGTGVVHQAPFFGEDDFRVCSHFGVIDKRSMGACPINESGKFTDAFTDLNGLYVKDADPIIINAIDAKGKLFKKSRIKHSYPFCWRSETPLIYKAVPCWFIRVEGVLTDCLVKNNSKIRWVPEAVGEHRFGNWLRDALDWCVSRNRYWGNPIPIWYNRDMSEVVCVGSIAELEELSGVRGITDIHREHIDEITIPSAFAGKEPLRRCEEVFDCWFESGSMPYAQSHYPFERAQEFENERFPADFIAEGVDQTRGWFYTLLVLGTALFDKNPFKNCVATGIVLASDGQKMSKRLKNYPDPMQVVEKFGADAVRLYLINSPAVKAESLKFKEDGVRDIQKDVFLPFYNSLKFLMLKIDRLQTEDGVEFKFEKSLLMNAANVMDRWILSFTQSHLKYVKDEMNAYHLYSVVPRLIQFIELLTNWYIRMNRDRLCARFGLDDCLLALNTLFEVELTMVHLMAPFTPFLSESFYQRLKPFLEKSEESVHFSRIPLVRPELIDVEIEEAVATMRAVIETGRIIRERNVLPLKQPLKRLVVICGEDHLRHVNRLEDFIRKELNVKQLVCSMNKDEFDVKLKVEPNFRTLGRHARSKMDEIVPLIRALSEDDVKKLQSQGELTLSNGFLIVNDHVVSSFEVGEDWAASEYNTQFGLLIIIDNSIDDTLRAEKWARELINRIQKLRKEAGVLPTDPIQVHYSWPDESNRSDLYAHIENQKDFIADGIRKPFVPMKPIGNVLLKRIFELNDGRIEVALVEPSSSHPQSPFIRIVQLNGDLEGCLVKTTANHDTLKDDIARVFGILEDPQTSLSLYVDEKANLSLTLNNDLCDLSAIYVGLNVGQWPIQLNDLSMNPKQTTDQFCHLVIQRTDLTRAIQPIHVLCENPKGCLVDSPIELYERIAAAIDLDENDIHKIRLSKDENHQCELTMSDEQSFAKNLRALCGQVIYVTKNYLL